MFCIQQDTSKQTCTKLPMNFHVLHKIYKVGCQEHKGAFISSIIVEFTKMKHNLLAMTRIIAEKNGYAFLLLVHKAQWKENEHTVQSVLSMPVQQTENRFSGLLWQLYSVSSSCGCVIDTNNLCGKILQRGEMVFALDNRGSWGNPLVGCNLGEITVMVGSRHLIGKSLMKKRQRREEGELVWNQPATKTELIKMLEKNLTNVKAC